MLVWNCKTIKDLPASELSLKSQNKLRERKTLFEFLDRMPRPAILTIRVVNPEDNKVALKVQINEIKRTKEEKDYR